MGLGVFWVLALVLVCVCARVCVWARVLAGVCVCVCVRARGRCVHRSGGEGEHPGQRRVQRPRARHRRHVQCIALANVVDMYTPGPSNDPAFAPVKDTSKCVF